MWEFQQHYCESLWFNRGVGEGTATFNGLYSSLPHLDFILALPSTSSDHCVCVCVCSALTLSVWLPSAGRLCNEAEGWDEQTSPPRACRRRDQRGRLSAHRSNSLWFRSSAWIIQTLKYKYAISNLDDFSKGNTSSTNNWTCLNKTWTEPNCLIFIKSLTHDRFIWTLYIY